MKPLAPDQQPPMAVRPSPTAAWPRPGIVLAIVSAGVILSGLDLFIVTVALPRIGSGLDIHSVASMSWLLNAYTIVFAALLVPSGRLADRYGRTLGFLIGAAIFTVASAACATADSLALLVAFRAVQAIGAALLTSTSLGLLLAAYPPDRRAGAVRLWTAFGGLTAVAGPALGGLLAQQSWRLVFLVNVPIGIAAIAAAARLLPRVPGDGGPAPDGPGTVLFTAGIAALTLALVNADYWRWGSAPVVCLLAGSALLLTVFTARSRRHPSPAFEIRLLRSPGTAAAAASLLLFAMAFGAMILNLVLLAENTWGWSALRSGVAATPNAVLVLPASILAGRLLRRLRTAHVIAAGCALYVAGILLWRTGLDPLPAYLPWLLAGLIFTGLGVGFTMPTLFGLGTASLPTSRFATGSGLVSMVRQLGIALGVAILVAVLGTPNSGHISMASINKGWLLIVLLAAAAPLPALVIPRIIRNR